MSFNTAAAFVRARGHAYRMLLSNMAYGVLVIGGAWWGGATLGLEGVAWGVGIAIVGCWLLVTGFASRAASLSPGQLGRALAQAVLPGVTVGLATLATAWGMRTVSESKVLVLGVAAALAGILTLWSLDRQVSRINHPALLRVRSRVAAVMTTVLARISHPFKSAV
jgi:hypothetical protein